MHPSLHDKGRMLYNQLQRSWEILPHWKRCLYRSARRHRLSNAFSHDETKRLLWEMGPSLGLCPDQTCSQQRVQRVWSTEALLCRATEIINKHSPWQVPTSHKRAKWSLDNSEWTEIHSWHHRSSRRSVWLPRYMDVFRRWGSHSTWRRQWWLSGEQRFQALRHERKGSAWRKHVYRHRLLRYQNWEGVFGIWGVPCFNRNGYTYFDLKYVMHISVSDYMYLWDWSVESRILNRCENIKPTIFLE